MEKIKTRIRNYFRKSSKLKILGDVVFYVIVILMIIPSTRRDLSALLIKATLRKPHVKTEKNIKDLTRNDYQLYLRDLDGKDYLLSQFRDKVTILNFWATWCPPCRAEMPSLQKLYDDYGDKVNFVLVSSEEPAKIKPFLEEEGYSMPIYIQKSQLPAAFPVSSIPATFVISKKGEIVVDKTGAANWNSPKFREQLDKLIKE